jgi:hypothetical protein
MSTDYINEYKQIFDYEKILVDKLNRYYNQYQKYIAYTGTDNGIIAMNDSYLRSVTQDISGAFNNIFQKINSLKRLNDTDKISTTTYDANYKSILEKHANNTKLRSELDEKLKTINNMKNSYGDIYANQYNATIYTGILWSILATTMIYYVFVKL